MSNESRQLETIFSMMSSGQRCIRVERHSLILWGITGGSLCLFTDMIIRPERFSSPLLYMTAVLLFMGIVLSGAAVADFSYSRHRKHARGESFPFIHAQILKAWCLLLVLGLLFTFGSGFFGGSYMIFGVWLFLVGLGLFIHGLFSEQLLEWAGVIIILLGIGPLALKANYEFTKWLAASVEGIGLPVLSFMLDGNGSIGTGRRLARFTLWLVLVLSPPLIAWHCLKTWYVPEVPGSRSVTLESFMREKPNAAPQIVTLPAGTPIPFRMRISGNLFRTGEAVMPLVLTRPVEIALDKGKPTGYFRVAGETWKYYKYFLSIWGNEELKAILTPTEGPVAQAGVLIRIEN